ncbi:MAG: alpha/beta hydrolase [Ferruginibacter sp.]
MLFNSGTIKAQLQSGLTGVPDTSFSNHSAFKSALKKYPQIKFPVTDTLVNVKNKLGVAYATFEKRKLLLDAFYSKQKSNSGIAVIIIHGGGWRSGNRTQHYALAQQLAAKGYTCFTPEYRLSTEALFPAAVYDLKAAIRWVRENAARYNIDTGKIAVAGFSAGGELAAFLATTGNMPLFEGTAVAPKTPSHVNALIDIDGTLSFVHTESSEMTDTSKRIGASAQWMGYTLREDFALWQAASPLSHVNKNTPPALFLNSSVARMHAGRDDFNKILTKYNIYTEVQTFENSPHTFCLFEPWFTPTVNCIDTFLKKVFKNNTQ